jgi:hypothetical protein
MRDEMKMYVMVEEGLGIGVERGIEDMNVVAAKGFKLLKNIQTPLFHQLTFSTAWGLYVVSIVALYFHSMIL